MTTPHVEGANDSAGQTLINRITIVGTGRDLGKNVSKAPSQNRHFDHFHAHHRRRAGHSEHERELLALLAGDDFRLPNTGKTSPPSSFAEGVLARTNDAGISYGIADDPSRGEIFITNYTADSGSIRVQRRRSR